MNETKLTKTQIQSMEALCKKLGCKNMTELFSRLIEAASFLSRIHGSGLELIGIPSGEFELITEAEREDAILHVTNANLIVNFSKDIREILKLQNEFKSAKDLYSPIGDA